jgi:hypothetical protein
MIHVASDSDVMADTDYLRYCTYVVQVYWLPNGYLGRAWPHSGDDDAFAFALDVANGTVSRFRQLQDVCT